MRLTACLRNIAFKVDEYLEKREQAKAGDHRALREKLELFFFHETTSGMTY